MDDITKHCVVTIEIFVSSLITIKYAATDLTQALSLTCYYCDAGRISPSVTVHVSSCTGS